MDLYLPIAGVSVSAPLLLALSAAAGFVCALFGVGGGFLMTPLLVFLGIPPAVAVASAGLQAAAGSASSLADVARRRTVDLRMGAILAGGGAVGAWLGVELFRHFRLAGQADVVVSLCYLVFLTLVGALMLTESLSAVLRQRRGEPVKPRRDRRPAWLYSLPVKLRFPTSRLYISVIPPLGLGLLAGLLTGLMGLGAGFLLVPAMIYLLRMPAGLVVGTSLVQILVAATVASLLHAGRNLSLDLPLTALLIVGGVVGAHLGARASGRFRSEELRAVFGLLVLLVGLKVGLDLFITPVEPFALIGGGD